MRGKLSFSAGFCKPLVCDGNGFLLHSFKAMSADFPDDLVCITGIMMPSVGKVSNQSSQPSLRFRGWNSDRKKTLQSPPKYTQETQIELKEC